MNIPIVLINLDRNPERLEMMKTNFQRLGLDFLRIPAVDGKTLSEDVFEQYAKARPRASLVGKWTKGKVGCNMSHRKAWAIAANSEFPYTAIFEDDIWMSDALKNFLTDISWIPKDADVIRLESTAFMKCLLSKSKVKSFDGRFIQRLLPNKSKNAFALGTGAYIIKKEAAKFVLDAPEDWFVYTDRSLFDHKTSLLAPKITSYQINPACCIQDKFYHENEADIVHPSEIETLENKDIYSNNNSPKAFLIKVGEPIGLYKIFLTLRNICILATGHKKVLFK